MVVSPSDAVIWHDLECGSYAADLALWHELAADARAGVAPTPGSGLGRVLDVGAGTGRVALALARAGHPVTAVDLDAELLDALSARAAGLDIEAVRADARVFELDRRDFALCLAPMQTLQLLGGTTGRLEFMAQARAHLAPGGLLACAIVTEIDPFDCDAGDLGPSEELARIAGATYISRATRVLLDSRVVRIERERGIVRRGRAAGEPAWEHDVIELDRVSVAQLEQEGREAGLTAAGTRVIAATEEHTASVVVMFRA
jgi:SAM-dependent methyltransferase